MAKNKEKIIIELDFDTSDFTQEAAKLNSEIKTLNKNQKELKTNGQEGSIAFQKNSEALRENKKALSENNKTITNLDKAKKSSIGSNEQLKAQLSILTADYNKLSKAERETTDAGKKQKAQIAQVTEELKGNEEAVGNNRRSVGDYGKALSGTPFGSFVGGIKAMGAAFIANPIGIVIMAIVGAFALLRKAFKGTEDGENKIAKVTAVLGTIFDKLLDALEPLANFIFDTLGAAFTWIGEKIDEVADGIESALALFGFEDAAEGLANYREELTKTAQAAVLVADARAKTDKLDRELIVETARIGAQAADARQKAIETENLSAAERNKLLNDAAKAIDELAAKEEKSARIKLKAIQLENAVTKSNKEALDAEANAKADLFNIQKKRSDFQKGLARDQVRVETELKKISEKRISDSKKAITEAISQNKEELKLFIASQGTRAKTLQEELAIVEEISKKKQAILEDEFKNRLVSQTQYNIQSLAIQNNLLVAQTELTIDNAQRELDEIIALNSSKLEANKFLNDELFSQEQEALQTKLDAELSFQALRLEQGVISEQTYNDAVNNINIENAAANQALADEKAEADAEAAVINLENQRELDILNNESAYQLRQQDLDRQRKQEIDAAEATGADTAKIHAKYDALELKNKQTLADQELAMASSLAGSASQILGEQSAAGKAFALAQALINTYQGIAAGVALGYPAAIPAVLAASATGFAAVANISATKAARGTIIGGKPHSQGGTKGYFDDGTQIEVEKGELLAVVNKRNTSLLNGLDSLNTFEGYGDSFFARGGTKDYLADGGVGIGNIGSSVDSEASTTEAIKTALANTPPPIVVVQDINEAQSSGAAVASRAEI